MTDTFLDARDGYLLVVREADGEPLEVIVDGRTIPYAAWKNQRSITRPQQPLAMRAQGSGLDLSLEVKS